MIDFRGTNCGLTKITKSLALDGPATQTGFHFVGENWQRQQRQRLISIKKRNRPMQIARCTPTSRHFPQNVNLYVTNQFLVSWSDRKRSPWDPLTPPGVRFFFFFLKSPVVHKKFKSLPPFCFVQFNSLAVHRANAIKFKSNRQKMAKETTATHTRCHTAHQLFKFSIFIHWPPPPPFYLKKFSRAPTLPL